MTPEQRQRLAYLTRVETNNNGVMETRDQFAELAALRMGAVVEQRSMTPRQRMAETLGNRWPAWSIPPLSSKEKILDLHRQRMRWEMTPEQLELERMRELWT